jgi:hypothetical protein
MLKHVAALASTLALSACSVFGVRSGTEEPRFEALGTEAGLEFRRYAPRLAAETVVPGPEEAARSEGFSRLARYIFGGNRGSARIAMTAPVAQDSMRIAMTAPVAQAATPGGYRIRFFLPASLRDPPAPLDARVTVVEVPAEARRRLEAALPATRWVAAGDAVAWFYDPPWTIPALRRNEVAVPVVPR